MRILLSFYCWSCLFGLLQGLSVNITRGSTDVFSNQDAKCGPNWCVSKNGYVPSHCICQCGFGYPTFVRQNGCMSNEALRNLAGCKVLFMDKQGRVLDNIAVVDPTKKENVKLKMPSPNLDSCNITGRSYLSLQQWQRTSFNSNAHEEIRVNGNHLHLKWDKSLGSRFRGRIIKIDFTCNPGRVAACVVFKANGTESYIIGKSTSAPPATTSKTQGTTVSTNKVSTVPGTTPTAPTTNNPPKITSSTKTSTNQLVTTTKVWQPISSVTTNAITSNTGVVISTAPTTNPPKITPSSKTSTNELFTTTKVWQPISSVTTKAITSNTGVVISTAPTTNPPKITPSSKTSTNQLFTTTKVWQPISSVTTNKAITSNTGVVISTFSTTVTNPSTTETQQVAKTTEASDRSTVTTSKTTTTAPQQTTEETTRKTTTLKSSTVVSTKVSISTTSVPSTTTGTSGTEEPTEETTPSEPAVSTELTEPTNGPETPGGKDANKGERTGEDKKDNTVVVAIIAASASVVCVAIISFCIWLIFTQRRKRQAGRCLMETEVIANPTSKNNLPLPSMLKNPVFAESDYLEPCDQPGSAHAKPLAVGSPVYDSANLHMGSLLLKNPLVKENRRTASAMPMKTLQKIPNNERSTSNENIYDNAERKSPCEEERPVYQALMVGRPKGGASKQAGDDAFYQALESAPPKRDQPESMYQALVIPSTGQSQEQQEIPEYLAVVTSPDEIPDYADCSDVQGRVDAQPTRAGLDNPVYDVLEEPDYAELEGPE